MRRNYCEDCGEPLEPHYNVCPNCGMRLDADPGMPPPNHTQSSAPYYEEGDTFGWAVLGFFFPLVGFILFLVWQNDKPRAASSAGKGALVGFIVQAVFGAFLST